MCSIIRNIIQCTISHITWCALSFKYYTMYNFTYNLMCSIIWNIIQCTISRITWCALSFEILYNVQFHV